MIEVQPMSVDQLAGAVVLFLGAVGSLLLVVWQSKCHCKVNLCYVFQCERRPPNEEELKTLADEAKMMKAKTDKMLKKEEKVLQKEDEILEEVAETPRLLPKTKSKDSMVVVMEPEPEPEPSIDKLV
jgi:anion-transporting  ArsA/GET3 family ATPase